jgi:hypothetical protein
LSDNFPFVHGYNYAPHETVYVRIKLVLYGNEELEEDPWVAEDHRMVQCNGSGSFVTLFDVDLQDESTRAAGLIEGHGKNSDRFARQRVSI